MYASDDLDVAADVVSAGAARLPFPPACDRIYDLHVRWLLGILLIALIGCGEQRRSAESGERDRSRIAAPDAGMPAGHAAEPRWVRVPAADRTPPQAVLRLGRTEAMSGACAPAAVRLAAPVVRPTAVGRDKQGMARIRVSVSARILCGDDVVPLTRYIPPPAMARTRIAPGTVVPTVLARTVHLELAEGRCPVADVRAIDGWVWADATSAWETEASSAPIRFSYAG
jgi:hypothetical protein